MKIKSMMFFDQDGRGGAATSLPAGPGTPPAQQQQQQQQSQEPKDPFADIDLDMLDDDHRKAIEQARSQLNALAEQAKKNDELARQWQSRYDRDLQALQKSQQQQQQQQQQPPQPPTLEEQFYQVYLEEGVPEEQARAAAKLQAKVTSKVLPNLRQDLTQAVAPFVAHQAHTAAQQALAQVCANDPMGAMRDPEIFQKVQEAVANLASSGKIVDEAMVRNLRNVFAYEKVEQGKFQLPQQQQQQQPPMYPNLQPMQIPSYGNPPPTAGPVAFPLRGVQPQQQNGLPPITDPDTAKAVNAVVAAWSKAIPGADKIFKQS